jgi:hypothetical protein
VAYALAYYYGARLVAPALSAAGPSVNGFFGVSGVDAAANTTMASGTIRAWGTGMVGGAGAAVGGAAGYGFWWAEYSHRPTYEFSLPVCS